MLVLNSILTIVVLLGCAFLDVSVAVAEARKADTLQLGPWVYAAPTPKPGELWMLRALGVALLLSVLQEYLQV